MPVPSSLFDGLTGRIIVRLARELALDVAQRRRVRPDILTTIPEIAGTLSLTGLGSLFPPGSPLATGPLVSLPVAQILQLEAAAADAPLPPLNSLTSYWAIEAQVLSPTERIALFNALVRLEEIDAAYFERSLEEPWSPAGANPYLVDQGYLNKAPEGIDALAAWAGGYDGSGMAFIDVERYWNLDHEDLQRGGARLANLIYGQIDLLGQQEDHGTHVLGIVAAQDNDVGTIGIAPNVATVNLASRYNGSTRWDLYSAIAAAASLAPNVLLIEVEASGYPIEVMEAGFDAIRLATALGVTVIEAAGNGSRDLDAGGWLTGAGLPLAKNQRNQLSRLIPDDDSGGIMVAGAFGGNVAQHLRWKSGAKGSTYGSRIDCYAWAESAYAPGQADSSAGERLTVESGADPNKDYISNFGGTSAASAIVAGAALLVHHMYQSILGSRMDPLQARYLLSTFGTPQETEIISGKPALIGVMPDLARIAGALAAFPDLFLRDSLIDTGVVPSALVGQSPDIFVLPAADPDPDTTFANLGDDGPPRTVRAGQTNYVYVRVQNRGGADASAATATVYWSEPTALLSPTTWHEIGTSAARRVSPGAPLVLGPIPWDAGPGERPVGDHGCFVALVGDPLDPKPLPPSAAFSDATGFISFLGGSNNVAWRNFDVIDVALASRAALELADFVIAGAADRVLDYDLSVYHNFPPGCRVVLVGPPELARALQGRLCRPVDLAMPVPARVTWFGVALGGGRQYRARFVVQPDGRWPRGRFQLLVQQFWNRKPVGRYTWLVLVGQR